MKTNNNIPAYRFQGYTDAWELRKLGEVAEINPKSVLPDEFEYVDLESVVGTEMISHRTEYKNSAPSRAQRVARKGDIFYQTVRPYQKNNYLFDIDSDNFVFSTGYAQLRPSCNGYFMFTVMQTEKFVNNVLDNCTGTSYPAINANELAEISIFLPPTVTPLTVGALPEQSAIGTFFSTLDRHITLHQRKLDTLKEQKKTYLKLLFPAKGQTKPALRFQGFEDDWEEVKLGEVCTIQGGNAWKSDSYSLTGEYLVVTIANVTGEYFIADKKGNRIDINPNEMQYVLKKGDILISLTGNVGRVSKMTESKGVLNQRVGKLTTTANFEFIFSILRTEKFENEMRLASQGAAQANISNKDVLQ
ncbi:TPA: restriction endonuclease subunit S, partial [Streptococcus suis]|nr:restriction endonuclease subunit S [Streptococcus suis]